MTARAHPLFADAKESARLMGMTVRQFLGYVENGDLPGPCKFDRWDVEHLRSIMRGEEMARHDDLEV